MQRSQGTAPQDFSDSLPDPGRGIFVDAWRYWEPLRLIYNLVLGAVVLGWLTITWPHFRPALTMSSVAVLCVLALVANVCYSAAYLVDLPAQHSPFAADWKRRRWILWAIGTILATVLANYWIVDEIYPFVR